MVKSSKAVAMPSWRPMGSGRPAPGPIGMPDVRETSQSAAITDWIEICLDDIGRKGCALDRELVISTVKSDIILIF